MAGLRGITPFVLVLAVAGCACGPLSEPGRAVGVTGTVISRSQETTVTTTSATGTTAARTTSVVRTATTPPPPPPAVTTTSAKRQYGWGLPEGPTSPVTNEDVIYGQLLGNRCGGAQQELDGTWSGLMTPRNAPLYQAAVDMCEGRQPSARTMFDKAAALGLQVDADGRGSAAVDCAILRAVRSVLDQVAPEAVACVPGTPPRWPTGDSSARDDPRTDLVEGTSTTTTSTS